MWRGFTSATLAILVAVAVQARGLSFFVRDDPSVVEWRFCLLKFKKDANAETGEGTCWPTKYPKHDHLAVDDPNQEFVSVKQSLTKLEDFPPIVVNKWKRATEWYDKCQLGYQYYVSLDDALDSLSRVFGYQGDSNSKKTVLRMWQTQMKKTADKSFDEKILVADG